MSDLFPVLVWQRPETSPTYPVPTTAILIFAIFFVTKVRSDQFLFLTTPAPKGYNDLYTLSTLIYFDKNIKNSQKNDKIWINKVSVWY